ncbi:MAG TPA: bifunctional diaminohydroxyphosphoribosylaminopyrimidine deaminase/5-amino-6-(5-phosphoribosylamino)uracil reductase RibD [Steroidobacteraceae bacterium]|nr:bifunctional diaminohydroxyphosphoribosylaminopyrimidine deaminase/5-amino-6-(5-phosphoribosylamino)uracil reductase RibD [Steroidobacteraceae bacterium]
MNFSAFDEAAMRRALELAARGLYSTQPNPRVGAVLARDGEIVGEGWHERAGEPHAEPIAIRNAGDRARGATAYVTLEPCNHHGRTPPCVDVLLASGVRRVVYAVGDPNPKVNGTGAARLRAAGVTVESGLLAADAEALNEGFMMRMRRQRPFVRLKSGASLDGRVALANGASQWITGEAARADVQHWRAQSGAVLTSAATVLADDPRLDVRLKSARQPLRVVLDRRRAVKKTAKILKAPGDVLIFAAASKVKRKPPADEMLGDARIERLRLKKAHLDLAQVLARLAELEINDLLVEAGPRLSGALLQAGLVDEWLVYLAPKLLGRDARPLAALPRLSRLADAPEFELRDSVTVGNDVRLRLRPKRES